MAQRGPSAADLYRRYSESGASGRATQQEQPRNAREAYDKRRQEADERLARPPRPSMGTAGKTQQGPSEEEMAQMPDLSPEGGEEYDTNLAEMKRELEMQEKRDQENLREFQEKAQTQVQERLAKLDENLKQSFERQMYEMENRYTQHSTGTIKTKSTDVLRINKILREIGRGLGPDWRPVFRIMVKQVALDKVEKELKKLERQKPFIQAYKALASAKDLSGEEFEIFQLIDALKTCHHYELAERALDILDTDGDELFTLGNLRTPIVSGSVGLTDDNGEEVANGAVNGQDGGLSETKSSKLRTPTFVEGPLADRKLLALSKKMGPRWEQVAAVLELSEEDIGDIKESESYADEYQINFKVLWNWRELANEDLAEDEALVKLKGAFTQIGRQDLVQMLDE